MLLYEKLKVKIWRVYILGWIRIILRWRVNIRYRNVIVFGGNKEVYVCYV